MKSFQSDFLLLCFPRRRELFSLLFSSNKYPFMPHTLHTSEKVNTRNDGTINCVKIQMKDIESSSAADHFVFIRECANLCARLRSHLEDELGGEKQKIGSAHRGPHRHSIMFKAGKTAFRLAEVCDDSEDAESFSIIQ